MSLTGATLRKQFLTVVNDQVGYTSGQYEHSRYGRRSTWASDWLKPQDWQGFWCNRFLSWGVDQVMGTNPGRAAVGHQAGTPLPVGFAATWLQRDWFRAHGRHVGYAAAEPGDFFLFLMNGPRKANPTNHIGVCSRSVAGRHEVLEGNLANPGKGADTIGVWYHRRPLQGPYGKVVAVYRPDWSAAAKVYNREHPGSVVTRPVPPPTAEQKAQLKLLGYSQNTAGVRKFQKANGLMGLGMVGPQTKTLLAQRVTEHRRKADLAQQEAEKKRRAEERRKAELAQQKRAEEQAAALQRHRVGGDTRFTTAVAVARDTFPDGAVTVYLVGDSAVDAALASTYRDGPVLLVPQGDTPSEPVLEEIRRLAPRKVKALGGPAAVSDAQLGAALAAADLT
ncbi:cell wall-binding repeat-containing protein [Ornithinimicrobium sediminis]|uniref:cell wall-binding repeat-containing protein n=1 Tax=Ornithinimicrobium sediminis TaxID=2904603 RepID=UPI001E601DCA|nr:cell wall-binding repeat-containing protein [Ornithinimicrobium sediminis]MCE0488334.1 cell wall-binding repeat-containing protein [Ornithinimicrobium sediminis]